MYYARVLEGGVKGTIKGRALSGKRGKGRGLKGIEAREKG